MMRAREKGLQLTTDIAPVPPVNGDIDRLEQVFNNLLDNALKHTPVGGKVGIIARQFSPTFIEVVISDTGPGIPPEQLPHVFERFYRADAPAAKTGTGLGLAIAREIVRAHGGNIQVNSTPGKGTEFLVKLPITLDVPPL